MEMTIIFIKIQLYIYRYKITSILLKSLYFIAKSTKALGF
jgi:hypothetical protein